ncbi:MAG: anhydro-N-acetylmuramic acid kinase [Chloroflexota bacterium]
MKKKYDVVGIMSGTSLDGLDIAFCELRLNNTRWEFDILEAETINYTQVWIELLRDAPALDGLSLALLHTSYGHWIGQTVRQFIRKHNISPKLIASHGHTIFHRPAEKMTLQIGSGAAIAAETGITTISDFRALDVALGGQGAPLVPIGDKLLFGDYNACVNIGGFANISLKEKGIRKAWDICPANIVLNYLTAKIGLPFDPSGSVAQSGNLDENLLLTLDDLPFYKQNGPKSLGKEWVNQNILPVLNKSSSSTNDIICTFTHHIAGQISKNLPTKENNRSIFTGGGTHNSYLIQLIREKTNSEIVVPSDKIIDYKEALIFALLGVLRMEKTTNCLSSVTGAMVDCSGGAIHFPPQNDGLRFKN